MKRILPGILIGLFVLVPSFAILYQSEAYAAGYITTESRVTTSTSINYTISLFTMPQFPSIDGNRVVWKDDRNGHSDIYMYDFATSTETRITTDVNDQVWPSISGNYIVWQDDRNGHWDIYMYDISTSTETRVTTSVSDEEQPCISGDRIVWHDDRNLGTSGIDIYLYTISTSTESTPFGTPASNQYSPWIDGNIVVWEDGRGVGGSDIYYYDFTSPVVDGTVVSSSTGVQYWPAVTGNRITWTEDRGTGTSYDVYLYDLSTSVETNLTNRAGVQAFGYVDGDIVVWTDGRGTSWDVYLYDLSRSLEYRVTPQDGSQQGVARIEGNRIVWGDNRNDTLLTGVADIYSGVITYDSTGPVFNNLPGNSVQINITEGQTIDTDPFLIQVYPTDSESGVNLVRFYAGANLICTDSTPDGDGIYDCLWTVSDSCSETEISVVAYDNVDNTSVISRGFMGGPSVCEPLAETGRPVILTIAGYFLLTGMMAVGYKNMEKV